MGGIAQRHGELWHKGMHKCFAAALGKLLLGLRRALLGHGMGVVSWGCRCWALSWKGGSGARFQACKPSGGCCSAVLFFCCFSNWERDPGSLGGFR